MWLEFTRAGSLAYEPTGYVLTVLAVEVSERNDTGATVTVNVTTTAAGSQGG